ncbi:MAG TPA: ATP-binding cassette domain-containing protein [Bacteroidia bacterium]|jgi:phospholipid/cholesterol/gamma-HCH transport system ATP-binding protein|nr:ATP-binding cassette domain-containing protein [Bacteroidia bacterium]
MEPAVIEIEHLEKSFGDKRVLTDMNLQLKKGENLAVLGKSGTGKSVLIKCIVGLLEPDNGKIVMLGKSIPDLEEDGLNEVRKRIGFLFQGAALYDSLTVRENLEFPLRSSAPKSRDEIDAIVTDALHSVDLDDVIDKMPSELSGGMKKRIGLARSLILSPEIIFYDEPTTGLDPITSREISKLILDVQKKHNASSIIITHDVECARITSNRMMVIHEGVCIGEGTFDELAKSDNENIRAFLG